MGGAGVTIGEDKVAEVLEAWVCDWAPIAGGIISNIINTFVQLQYNELQYFLKKMVKF